MFVELQKRTYAYLSLQFKAEINTRDNKMAKMVKLLFFITFHTNYD